MSVDSGFINVEVLSCTTNSAVTILKVGFEVTTLPKIEIEIDWKILLNQMINFCASIDIGRSHGHRLCSCAPSNFNYRYTLQSDGEAERDDCLQLMPLTPLFIVGLGGMLGQHD